MKKQTQSAGEVIDLMKELQKSGEECLKPFLLLAERNEMFVAGDQFQDINPTSFVIEDAWKTHLPKITQNHLRNLVNTYKSRITKDRPSVTAWPSTATPEAKESATISAKLIEYIEKELQIDQALDDVVRLAAMHGIAGFKIIYNPTTDQVEWHKISLFDVIIDPTAESFETAKWCIFRSYIDKYEAKEEFSQAGIEEDPPVGMYKVNQSEEREGVEILELWHKPCARIPSGLFAKTVGNNVLDSRDYPYIFPALEDTNSRKTETPLPLVYFKIDYKRGYPYADTWLNDAISEQRQINETESTLLRLRRETGNVKVILPNSSVMQQYNTNSQVLINPEGTGNIGYLAPPVINSLLFADRDYHFRRLYDIAGLNEQLVGVENLKAGTSGKQIAYLSELDSMKHKGTTQSLESMLVRAWKLTLQLIQNFYIDERIMRIASDDGFATVAFRGADIQGVTVDIAPRAGLERFAATKAAQVEADLGQGLVAPQDALERRSTGQPETISQAMVRRMMALEVRHLLQGGQPFIDETIDPAIAADEIEALADLLGSQGVPLAQLDVINQFAALYRQRVIQQGE